MEARQDSDRIHHTYRLKQPIFDGGLGGGHSPTQWGVWGSEPPDPGSVLTNNNRNPQVFIIYRSD